jgi:hypothetical protein
MIVKRSKFMKLANQLTIRVSERGCNEVTK